MLQSEVDRGEAGVILHVERRAASVEKQKALGVALFGCDVDHRAAVRIDRFRVSAALLCAARARVRSPPLRWANERSEGGPE